MYTFDVINSVRQKFITLVSSTPLEIAHQIPAGFNNNIIWNFGHMVVSGYGLAFKATQVNPGFPVPYVDKYKKGSKPGEPADQEELDVLIDLAVSFTETIRTAYNEGAFKTIEPYTTETFGIPITTIEDMFTTIAVHDTLHTQVAKDYYRILNSKN